MLKELDLVHEDDQITHQLSLGDEDMESEDMLSKFSAIDGCGYDGCGYRCVPV